MVMMSENEVRDLLLRLMSEREMFAIDPERAVNDVMNPKWEEFYRERVHVHEWQSHVPDGVDDVWDQLPVSVRLAFYMTATKAAENEVWPW